MKFKLLIIPLITLFAVGVVLFEPNQHKVFADTTTSSCSALGNTSTTAASPTLAGDNTTPTTCSPTSSSTSTTPSDTSSTNSAQTSTATSDLSPTATNADTVCQSTQPDNTNSNTATTDVTSSATNTCASANSTSGDATVTSSGSNNSASSGAANNSLNQVNSVGTSGTTQTSPTTFTDNVNGDQNGNIVVDPAAGTPASPNNSSTNSVATSTNSISNTDNLTSNSGNSSITNSGNNNSASSGNAESMASVVNLLDSMISSGQSFEGTINIYGNLYGDILLPESLISQIVPNASVTNSSTGLVEAGAINNNVNLVSYSGQALISDSGNGNSAISGNASTLLNLANYINANITASNLFLVIINVGGVWQGYLLGQVSSSNTSVYLLASGLTNNYITQPNNNLTGVNSTSDTINNNINLAAYTGNASVINSGNGNSAISGNAEAIANIANFEYDNINLSGWFGILFINIFGNWYGSLSTYNSNPVDPSGITVTVSPEVISYRPANPQLISNTNTQPVYVTYLIYGYTSGGSAPVTLTSYITKVVDGKSSSPASNTPAPHHEINYWLIGLSTLPILIVTAVERRYFANKLKSNL